MAQERWDDDETLLADLRQALAFSAPRDDTLLEAGRAAFTWRTVDEDLARLAYDSLLEDLSTVRGADAAPRTLVFETTSISLEIELVPGRLVGQLVPPTPGQVVLQSREEEVGRAAVDTEGCFSMDVPAGTRVRLRCTTGRGDVVTEWVTTA